MKRILTFIILFIFLFSVSCTKDKSLETLKEYVSILFNITLNGPTFQGDGYEGFLPATDLAIWIADAQGKMVKTLKVTQSVVSVDSVNGEHLSHLPAWGTAEGITYADLQTQTDYGVAPGYDAVSAASPRFVDEAQVISAEWNLTDSTNSQISSGIYSCYIEAANIEKYAASPENISILSESTFATFDVETGAVETATATDHIQTIAVTFNESNGVSKTSVIGPD